MTPLPGERKSIGEEVSKKPHLQTIAGVIIKEYKLGRNEKRPIAAMLALAWIAGAQTSLSFPELTSRQLMNSEEAYELTKGAISKAIKKQLGRVGKEVIEQGMYLEEHLWPLTLLKFDDYSYFLTSN